MQTFKHLLFAMLALMLSVIAQAQTFGLPQTQQGEAVQEIVTHSAYTSAFNTQTLTPDWVWWKITAQHLRNPVVSREGYEFEVDPSLKSHCPDSRQYSRSGYDRGHMCPAADMKWSENAMKESFYLSNICPQNNTLNAGLWLVLEKKCRSLAYICDSVEVVSGPVHYNSRHKVIGSDKVVVPEAFYKAVLFKYKGQWYTAGWIVRNEPLDNTNDHKKYMTDINTIETVTGHKLWPKLDSEAKALAPDKIVLKIIK